MYVCGFFYSGFNFWLILACVQANCGLQIDFREWERFGGSADTCFYFKAAESPASLVLL